MTDHTTGRKAVQGEVAAALSGAVAAADAAAAGEQLPLFPSPIPAVNVRTGRVFDVEALQADAEARRKAGRPAGATNKATARMREHLLARGINPAEWLVRWLQVTPDQLADYLGCTTVEAFREQRIIADALRPIFIPNMAATDDQGKPVPVVNITIGGQPGAAGPGRAPWEYIEQIQSVSALADDGSHGDQVTPDGQAIGTTGETRDGRG